MPTSTEMGHLVSAGNRFYFIAPRALRDGIHGLYPDNCRDDIDHAILIEYIRTVGRRARLGQSEAEQHGYLKIDDLAPDGLPAAGNYLEHAFRVKNPTIGGIPIVPDTRRRSEARTQ